MYNFENTKILLSVGKERYERVTHTYIHYTVIYTYICVYPLFLSIYTYIYSSLYIYTYIYILRVNSQAKDLVKILFCSILGHTWWCFGLIPGSVLRSEYWRTWGDFMRCWGLNPGRQHERKCCTHILTI